MPEKSLSERLMDACVQACGGTAVRPLLPREPTFDNADYYFPQDNVVSELKTLMEDTVFRADTIDKVSDLYYKWSLQRLVPPIPSGMELTLSSDSLPWQCQEQLFSFVRTPFANLIKKTNRQIKLTKNALGCADAKGLLIVINDGNFTMENPTAVWLIKNLLENRWDQKGEVSNNRARYRSIDNCLYMTFGMPSYNPEMKEDQEVVAFYVRDQTQSIAEEFFNRLRNEWLNALASLAEVPIRSIGLQDETVLQQMTFAQSGRRPR